MWTYPVLCASYVKGDDKNVSFWKCNRMCGKDFKFPSIIFLRNFYRLKWLWGPTYNV